MPESSNANPDREQFWKTVVVPTARGLEQFFWNLAWFVVIVCLLFSFNPFRQGRRHEDRTSPALGNQSVPEQPSDQR
jgi:hypothetical protein